MSVRKRRWTTPRGDVKEGWQADYLDGLGKRRRKMFAKKKEAEAFVAGAIVEVRDGLHVPDTATVTVKEAGDLWIKSGAAAGLEVTTIEQRHQHLNLHIIPTIGMAKLNSVTVPFVRSFQDQLRESGRSSAMVKRCTVSLGSILADAQSRGLCIRNAVHEMSRSRASSSESKLDKRQKKKLRIGVDIPDREEARAILSAAAGRWRPIIFTLLFTGIRASELRGLAWSEIDLDKQTLTILKRADRHNQMGPPKSANGSRTLPLPTLLVNILREWKLACPKGPANLVFPNGAGNVESHRNIVSRGLVPTLIAAGVTVQVLDKDGLPATHAKYTGLHAMRHFYASWCINPVSAGGMGLVAKVVQERLGHGSIAITLDTYGHLFPSVDGNEEVTLAALSLVN